MDKLIELEKKLKEYREALDKAVRESQVGSPAAYENASNVEGAGKEKKYQGGDPRHFYGRDYANRKDNKTRAGIEREIPHDEASGKPKGMTSGVSSIRPKKHSEYNRDTTIERGSNKEVKWYKSQDENNDLIKFDEQGQWSLEKSNSTTDRAQRIAPGARQPAYVRGVFGDKARTAQVVDTVVTPQEQVQAKKDKAAADKAKAETEAKARRDQYRKEGLLKAHDDEKEDKELIAEAIDEHNEKKHGEAKDKDSAFEEKTLKSEEISIGANGQWKIGSKSIGSDIPYTDKDHDKKEDIKSLDQEDN